MRTEWKRYINQQYTKQMKQIKMALQAQELALNELKQDNERLYFKAIYQNSIDNSPIYQQVIERHLNLIIGYISPEILINPKFITTCNFDEQIPFT